MMETYYDNIVQWWKPTVLLRHVDAVVCYGSNGEQAHTAINILAHVYVIELQFCGVQRDYMVKYTH